MSEGLNKILEYEKRLMQDRQQLMELLSESTEDNEELVSYKLECFQKEIAFMNRQVELLKQETRSRQALGRAQTGQNISAIQSMQEIQTGQVPPGAVQSPQLEQTAQRSSQTANIGVFSQQSVIAQNVTQPLQTTYPDRQPQTRQTTQQELLQRLTESQNAASAKKDLEQTVGKSLMGIFASVLIFSSLILFATLLLPYFNDTAKMVTTYIISFGFLGVGLTKMKQDKTNKFYMALTGCGIGALYISLLLSNMYFKVLGDIPLYVLICIWGVGVCLFAKQQSLIFQIIGELGITIAMMFGCLLCVANEDTVKFLALIIFYVISAGVFYGVHFQKEFVDNLIHHISNVINVYLLAFSCFELVGNGLGHFESWTILVLIIIGLGSTLWHSQEKESFSFSIFAIAYIIIGYGMLDTILFELPAKVYAVTDYIVSMVLLAVFEWKKADGREGKYVVQAVLLFLAIHSLDSYGDLYDYGMVPLLILPVMAAGFFLKNWIFKYASLVMLVVYTFAYYSSEAGENIHFVLEGIALAAGFALLWWKKEQYDKVFKYSLHTITLLFLLVCVSDVVYYLTFDRWENHDIPAICNYTVFTLFNIGMMKSVFGRNLLTGEKENPVVFNIANMLAMLVGTFMIVNGYEGFWNIILILTVLGAFMVNAKNLLDKRSNLLAGIYVGIKFTILMIVILDSFDSANYVISISCLLLAIAGIVLGFVGEYKSLRVFGLLLSMISIFKLIMVDISYDNTLGHAISFFVSGILCFVISLIYNYIDKRFAERA